ncbi:MAG: YqgE/AlgH family protein [Actinobacteria bacterium]|nr:YqgE/AlgH family protein [Actinomycetota bacterium]
MLVATPRLIDPNFYRTVVLLIQADEEGVVGLVLNRPTSESVADHLPDWADRAADPGLIHRGGPVEPEVAISLCLTPQGMPSGVPGVSLVDVSSPPEPDGPPVRVYSGYAGWGKRQLQGELDEGSWYVVQASPDDPFEDPVGQWRRVLRRQPGFLSVVSSYPDDIRMN